MPAKVFFSDLSTRGHRLGRLPRERLGQVPDDAFHFHDEHGRFRVARIVIDLAADLVLVFTCYGDFGQIVIRRVKAGGVALYTAYKQNMYAHYLPFLDLSKRCTVVSNSHMSRLFCVIYSFIYHSLIGV